MKYFDFNVAIVTNLIVISFSIYLVHKIAVRLRLSRAKHPSLRGHAKWSRKIAKLVPYFEYHGLAFFSADGSPSLITINRLRAFNRLCSELATDSPKSIQKSQSLEGSVSDVEFTRSYRVPFPFRNYVNQHLNSGFMVEETKGVRIKDLDGNWAYDLTGSYGVNLFGYDFYKDCLSKATEKVKDLGPVLGPYHPVIIENVKKLKAISGLDEVSFHMSGTEAVMQAVRLARYHTGRTHLVRFCGAYHGWWDGVQPGVGNQRRNHDIYTLADMSDKTLKVLATRKDIACVLVNPLQALHPNRDASGDASLINSTRSANFNKQAYIDWLEKLRKTCIQNDIVFILDEVFTGFRLAYGGAQSYFKTDADIVVYGKSLGGGLPVGVVCGKHALMKRFKTEQPANVSFARGTFNSHPLVMACMCEFLNKIESKYIQQQYVKAEECWNGRVEVLNHHFRQNDIPIKIENLLSIWTVLFEKPSAYNWMLQFYLKRAGIALSWIGTGRIIMSHNFSEQDFSEVVSRFVEATLRMKKDGWWWQTDQLSNRSLSQNMLKNMLVSKFPLLGKLSGVNKTTGFLSEVKSKNV